MTNFTKIFFCFLVRINKNEKMWKSHQSYAFRRTYTFSINICSDFEKIRKFFINRQENVLISAFGIFYKVFGLFL